MMKRTRIGALALVLAAAGSAGFAHRLHTASPAAAARGGRCEGAPVTDTTLSRPTLPGMRFLKIL